MGTLRFAHPTTPQVAAPPIRYHERLSTTRDQDDVNQPRKRCDQSAEGPAGRRFRRVLAGLCVLSVLSGCAALGSFGGGSKSAPAPAAPAVAAAKEGARTGQPTPGSAPSKVQGAPKAAAPAPDLVTPPEPQWRTTGEVLGLNPPAQQPVAVGQGSPAFTPFSPDLPDLRREVALICGSARLGKQKDYLAPLVTDLFLSNADPAFATEALIQGDCGSLAEVVRELVAQGGNEVVSAVVNRALFLGGPRAEGTIRAAASSGLNRDLVSPLQRSEPTGDAGSLAYAMAYFPSRGAESGVATATAINTLYSNATPGYGVYTFVLLGAGFDPAKDADRARYAELLRVIETYVLAGDQGARGPRAEAHAFLIAIRPDRKEAKLSEQTGPEFSAAIRQDLIQYLRRSNQPDLARRLETLPGPFLISGLEPRLLPTSQAAPRLVSDLSGLGAEYLYAVVDAYDRPIPVEQQGRPEGLAAIRERLLGLFSRKVATEELSPALKDAWVFRLGGPLAPKPQDTKAQAAAGSTPGESASPDQPAAQTGPQPATQAAGPTPAVRKRAPKKAVRRS